MTNSTDVLPAIELENLGNITPEMTTTPTHAGAVVFRKTGPQNFYLVVSSSDGLNWVFPKGHIDPGETAEIAALRELAEEAGVVGKIVAPLSVQQFRKRDKDATVQYFLVSELGSIAAAENRILRWEEETAALELLTFAEGKAALLEGAAVLRRQ